MPSSLLPDVAAKVRRGWRTYYRWAKLALRQYSQGNPPIFWGFLQSLVFTLFGVAAVILMWIDGSFSRNWLAAASMIAMGISLNVFTIFLAHRLGESPQQPTIVPGDAVAGEGVGHERDSDRRRA